MKTKSIQHVDQNRNHNLHNDEKINDVIFIEEAQKFRTPSKKKYNESRNSFPILSRNSNELSYGFNNQKLLMNNTISNYYDQSQLAVCSSSNIPNKSNISTLSQKSHSKSSSIKINEKLDTSYMQNSASARSIHNLNATTIQNSSNIINFLDRTTIRYSNNESISSAKKKKNQLANEMKKLISVKPIVSNISNDIKNQSNSISDISNSISRLNRSSKHKNEKSSPLETPNSLIQQQSFNYISNRYSSNTPGLLKSNINEPLFNKQDTIIVNRSKTNLSNYFSNLANISNNNFGTKYGLSTNSAYQHNSSSRVLGHKETVSINSANMLNNTYNTQGDVTTRALENNVLAGIGIKSSKIKSDNEVNEIYTKFIDMKPQELIDNEKKNSNETTHEQNTSQKNIERKIESTVKTSKNYHGKIISNNSIPAVAQNFFHYENNHEDKKESEKGLNNIFRNQQKSLNRKSSNVSLKRPISALSFKSRNINDSYAYTDVKKYIEENDLMPPERVEFIKAWITEVNLFIKDLEQTVS